MQQKKCYLIGSSKVVLKKNISNISFAELVGPRNWTEIQWKCK